MSKKIKVFILGAGFSRHADFPLTNEFLPFIKNFLLHSLFAKDKDIRKALIPFLDEIESTIPWLSQDVESLFTYLDLALLRNDKGIFNHLNYSLNDLNIIRNKLSGVLYRAFDYKHFELWSETIYGSETSKVIKERKRKNGIYWKFCENLI
ncbi:MAG: hypothetical protein ACFFFT_16145 [Candidatus Thorarchaeota archaeon]